MADITLGAITTAVGTVLSQFLPIPPGMQVAMGAVALIGTLCGFVIGEISRRATKLMLGGLALLSLVIGVASYCGMDWLAAGEPGRLPALGVLALTAAFFLAFGFLVKVGRIALS